MRAIDLSLAKRDPGQSMGSTQSRYLVFDTETTGLGADHRVVEIGIVEIVNRRRTGREFHKYINPERSIDADAERVHGLSARFLAGKPRFREIVDELIEFLGKAGDCQLVAHNATFDVNKLNAEFARLGLSFRIDDAFEIIDTMKLSRKIHPGQRASLDAICDRYGISRSQRQVTGLHGALDDSQILASAFLAMTAGQGQLGYSQGRQAVAATGSKLDRSKYGPLKVINATPDEESAHARLCDAIEKSSGGYCGFRGKWTKPEKSESAKMESQAPAPEFGSGTAAPAPMPAKPSLGHLVMTATIAQPTPVAPPTVVEQPKPAAKPSEVTAAGEIEFAPSI